MNHNEELEWEFLEYISAWMSDYGRPGDYAVLEFPGSASELSALSKSGASAELQGERLTNIALGLKDKGYIDGNDFDGFFEYRMTRDGYALLEAYRDRRGLRRVKKSLISWSDKILSSIILPVLVAVLTVLVMEWLGIANDENAPAADGDISQTQSPP